MLPKTPYFGAGEGNRTLVLSLEGFSSTIKLHPRNSMYTRYNCLSPKFYGGGGRIRTYVGVSQQIYSLPPLATRAPLPRKLLICRRNPEVSNTELKLQRILVLPCRPNFAIPANLLSFAGAYRRHHLSQPGACWSSNCVNTDVLTSPCSALKITPRTSKLTRLYQDTAEMLMLHPAIEEITRLTAPETGWSTDSGTAGMGHCRDWQQTLRLAIHLSEHPRAWVKRLTGTLWCGAQTRQPRPVAKQLHAFVPLGARQYPAYGGNPS